MLGAGFMGAGIASIAVQQGTLVRLKDTDHARVGEGARRRARRAQGAADEEADHAACSSTTRWLLVGGTDRLLGLRQRRPRDRGGVRGPRAQAPVLREVEAVLRADADLRVEHQHDPDRADRRGVGAPGARARDALLLARAQDAAARGDRHAARPTHEATVDRGGVRQEARQDGDRRERRPGLLHQPHPLPYMNEAGRLLDEGARSTPSTRRSSTSASRSARSRCSTRSASTSAARSGRSCARRSASAWRPASRCGASSSRPHRAARAARASTSTTRRERRARSTRRSTRCCPAARERRDVPADEIAAPLRAGDGERGGALPRGGHPALAARRRRRRGVRPRLSAVPRRPVPVRGRAGGRTSRRRSVSVKRTFPGAIRPRDCAGGARARAESVLSGTRESARAGAGVLNCDDGHRANRRVSFRSVPW